MFTESFHPVQNGVTTSVLTLVAALREQRHHVCVFAPAHHNQPPAEARVFRFPSFVSAFNRGYPLAFPFYPRLALETYFDRLKLDLVHTHTPFVLGLTGGKLAARRRIPLVTTFHTLYTQYTHYVPLLPEGVTQSIVELYLPWYYNRCAQIVCPSQVAKDALTSLGVATPIEIIPTAVPLPPAEAVGEGARAAARRLACVPPDARMLLYVGRLAPEKNLPLLLEAFSRIRRCAPDCHLAIAGDGPAASELAEKAKELPDGDAVHLLGAQPRERVTALFAAADLFCFPSPSETQGLVVAEARAAGLPCLVVRAGGAAEAVTDGEDGFVVDPDDPEQFAAKALSMLLDRGEADRLRSNARRNALRSTPEQMARRMVEVYQSVLALTQGGSMGEDIEIEAQALLDEAARRSTAASR